MVSLYSASKWRSSVLILVLVLSPSTAFTIGRTTCSCGSNKKSIQSDGKSNTVVFSPERFELAVGTSQESVVTAEAQVGGALIPPSDEKLEIPRPPIAQELPLLQLALAGSVATFLADLSIHPMDCIKTIQQSDQGLSWSVIDAARYLYKQDGFYGFYHGFLTYAIADSGAGAIKFGVWETWKKQWSHASSDPPIWFVATGAALSFLLSSFVIVPGEFLKQQLQMSHYSGFWEAVQNVAYTNDGSFNINGLFTGYDGVLCRDIPYTILELGMYDTMKRIFDRSKSPEDVHRQGMIWENLFCAAATGVVAAILTTPMDVIKTKLMVDNYSSFMECLLSSVHQNGVAVLFSGVVARIAWIVPFTMLYLPSYDVLKNLMWDKRIKQLNSMPP